MSAEISTEPAYASALVGNGWWTVIGLDGVRECHCFVAQTPLCGQRFKRFTGDVGVGACRPCDECDSLNDGLWHLELKPALDPDDVPEGLAIELPVSPALEDGK